MKVGRTGGTRSVLALLALLGAAAACDTAAPEPDGTYLGRLPVQGDPVLVGAGDIASCWWRADGRTAALLDGIPGIVFTLGDNVYPSGTAARYAKCYGGSWGRAKERTYPAAGNHDYKARQGAAYYDYFGANAGPRGRGYYSYDVGEWHVVVYNSETDIGHDSDQLAWLREDLAAHPAPCLLAYGHQPRFSSGKHGDQEAMDPLWRVLYAAGADVIVAGHEHNYERFAPQSPDGRADAARGIRAFVVGTGGAPLSGPGERASNSEVLESGTHGVLKLTLRRGSYDWAFVPVKGARFSDRGRGSCHAGS